MDFVDAIGIFKFPTPFAVENGPKQEGCVHEKCGNESDAKQEEQILRVLRGVWSERLSWRNG